MENRKIFVESPNIAMKSLVKLECPQRSVILPFHKCDSLGCYTECYAHYLTVITLGKNTHIVASSLELSLPKTVSFLLTIQGDKQIPIRTSI